MSFRLKTILGVALIEGVLLLLLVWSSLNYLERSSQDELAIRADTTSRLLANMTRDAVLATDLAHLESSVQEIIKSPEVVYIRIRDRQQVLAQAGAAEALARPFSADNRLGESQDGVFDVAAQLAEDDYLFGRVELGLSVERATHLLHDARRKLQLIATVEIVLVALFSFVLGTYLTRGLGGLTRVVREIESGALGVQVKISGSDELAVTGKAINAMSLRLAESRESMRKSVEESHELSRRLQENELRLGTILNTAVDGFITIDDKGRISEINPSAETLFGYDKGELAGRNVSCLMPEPDSSAHDGYLSNYLEGGEARIIGIGREVTGLRRDGSTFPMDLAVSEMRLGDARMFVGLVRDITERKQMELATRRSEAVRAAVIAASQDALVNTDIEGRIIEFNTIAEDMFGYSRKEVLGQQMADLLIPVHLRDAHKQGMARYRDTREGPVLGTRIEVVAMRRGGEMFPVELTISPIELDGYTLFTSFIRDISERRATENQLRESRHRAEEASAAKSRFLAHMSHEIRSPLNAMLGSVGLLLDGDLEREQQLYANTAQTAGRTLLSLISNILDFSKIEAGRLELDVSEFDLDQLIRETADLVAFRAQGRPIQTAVALQPNLHTHLLGDGTRIRQILLNLMDNALKFTERGAVVLQVEQIGEQADTLWLRFLVEDSGPGITEAAQQELFDEFSQVDSSDSTRYEGSGLGLSICKGLIHLMQGRIGLDSEPGHGSRFWAEIPLRRVGEPGPVHDPGAGHLNFLLAGLHPLIRGLVARHCESQHCRVEFAGDCDSVLGSVTGRQDVLMLDASLPEEELRQCLQRSLELGVGRRLLLGTGFDPQHKHLVAEGLVDEIITMPLLVNQAVAALSCDSAIGGADLRESCQAAGAAVHGRGRILLAEDSRANQLVASGLLRKAGYRVEIAGNGLEAISALDKDGYDLVLMDLRMPEMDGIEATRRIRAGETGRRLPIVALSANVLQEDIDRCMAAGMDAYLPKPIDRDRLLATIEELLPTGTAAAAGNSRAAPADSGHLLDERALQSLAADTSPEEVPAMLTQFVDEISQRAQRIHQGLADLPLEALEDEAHTLKSCAGTFGALRLQMIARDMEAACQEGDRPTVQELEPRLEQVLAQTIKIYKPRCQAAGNGKTQQESDK